MNYTEKNKLLDKISAIGLMAIFAEVFLYGVDICYTGIMSEWLLKIPMILNVIGGLFLLIAIGLFVYAYKNARASKVIYGIEFLFLAFMCPFLTFWYTKSKAPLNTVSPKIMWIIVLVYYIIRVGYACVKAYMQSSARQLKKKKN